MDGCRAVGAEAITGARADEAAKRATAGVPAGDLYRLSPRALRASDVVTFAGLMEEPVGTRGQPRLGRRAWLYWFDPSPVALFAHPSLVLVVDDRTGRVSRRLPIDFWPLINGSRPPFLDNHRLRSSRRFLVTSRPAPLRPPSPAAARRLRRAPAPRRAHDALPAAKLANDCVLMFGGVHDTLFERDFRDFAGFASKRGIRTYFATRAGAAPTKTTDGANRPARAELSEGSEASLNEDVKFLVDTEGCRDILLFFSGHGTRAPGVTPVNNPDKFPPGIETRSALVAGSGPVVDAGGGKKKEMRRLLTAETLLKVVAAQPKITFKFKINSCYSGRFVKELGLPRNVLVVETASRANELAFSAFDAGQVTRAIKATVRKRMKREVRQENKLRKGKGEKKLTRMEINIIRQRVRGEVGAAVRRRAPNPGSSEFVHGNIASMGRFFDDPPADYHKVGGSPLATAVAEPSQSDFAANAGRTHPQTAINADPIPVGERRTP